MMGDALLTFVVVIGCGALYCFGIALVAALAEFFWGNRP